MSGPRLPVYTREKYQTFVEDCREAGFDVQHYRGRFYYEGPAVVTDDIQTVIRATSVPVQWDNMGLDWVVYPR